MIFLRPNDDVGQLDIEQVFVYFDGPKLFIAENPAGQKFVVNCLDSDDDQEYWLMSAVSDRRFLSLVYGNLALRDVFTNPELGRVSRLTTNRLGQLQQITSVLPNDITDDELPSASYKLEVEEHLPATNAAYLARSLNASVVLLHLFPGRRGKEAPAKKVGKILTSFGDYVASKVRRLIQPAQGEDEGDLFQLNMIGTFAGSLGVELAVRGEDPRIATAVKDAIEEISSADDLETFKDQMAGVEDAQVDALRRFLTEMRKAETDVKIEAAAQSDVEPVSASVALPRVREAVKILRREPKIGTETKRLVGELIAISLRTRKFEIVDVESDETLKGSMEASIFHELRTIELPRRYRVVLEADVRQTPGGARHVSPWRMISATKL